MLPYRQGLTFISVSLSEIEFLFSVISKSNISSPSFSLTEDKRLAANKEFKCLNTVVLHNGKLYALGT